MTTWAPTTSSRSLRFCAGGPGRPCSLRKPRSDRPSWYEAVRFPTVGNDATASTGDAQLDQEIREAAAGDVEQLIEESPSLSLCADLANGSKHLTLTRPRVDAATKIGGRHYDLHQGGKSHRIAVSYAVEAAGERRDAFELANACMSEWSTYLKAKGLLAEG